MDEAEAGLRLAIEETQSVATRVGSIVKPAEASAMLEGLPGVRVTVIDVDTDMLGEARRRLAPFADRVALPGGQLPRPAARRGRRHRLPGTAPRP
jgi:hypothetical protein